MLRTVSSYGKLLRCLNLILSPKRLQSNLNPLPGSSRRSYCFHDPLNSDRIVEIRMKVLASRERLQKIAERRYERVLVSDDVTGLPEIRRVRMIGAVDQQIARRP